MMLKLVISNPKSIHMFITLFVLLALGLKFWIEIFGNNQMFNSIHKHFYNLYKNSFGLILPNMWTLDILTSYVMYRSEIQLM